MNTFFYFSFLVDSETKLTVDTWNLSGHSPVELISLSVSVM